jgi:hypothetical protein
MGLGSDNMPTLSDEEAQHLSYILYPQEAYKMGFAFSSHLVSFFDVWNIARTPEMPDQRDPR